MDSLTERFSNHRTKNHESVTSDSVRDNLSSAIPSFTESDENYNPLSSYSQREHTTSSIQLQNTKAASNAYSSGEQPTSSSANIQSRQTSKITRSINQHTSLHLPDNQRLSSAYTKQLTTQLLVDTKTTHAIPGNDRINKNTNIKGPVIGGVLGFLFVALVTCIVICRYRNVGLFKKPKAITDNSEMDVVDLNTTNISQYHDIMLNSNSVPNGKENATYGIKNDTEESTTISEVNETSPNNVYAVVVKKQTPHPQKSDITNDNCQDDDTEGNYDRLNKPLIAGKHSMENNVYDSCLGNRDENDPTYNTTFEVRGDSLDNGVTYDHAINIKM